MWIGIRWMVLDCSCTICTSTFIQVQETVAMKLTSTVEEYKLPIVQCNKCKGNHVVYKIIKIKTKK
jgi:hypothetical protein